MEGRCQIYYYADDITLSYLHKDPQIVKTKLEDVAHSALQWFRLNCMEANPSKFQSMVLSRKKFDITFYIDRNVIQPTNYVYILCSLQTGLSVIPFFLFYFFYFFLSSFIYLSTQFIKHIYSLANDG